MGRISKALMALSMFVATCCVTPMAAKKTDSVPDVSSAVPDPTPNDDVSDGQTKRTIMYLDFEIDADSVAPFITALREAKQGEEIIILINSPGGSMSDGTNLATAIRFSQATIVCEIVGNASSEAGVVLQSCPTRVMDKAGVIMIHMASSVAAGNSSDMRTGADDLDVADMQMFAALMSRSKLTLPQLKRKTAGGRRWWILPDEALKLGLIDAIL
jgi:ATP-dependent Clp protease, protease subunit